RRRVRAPLARCARQRAIDGRRIARGGAPRVSALHAAGGVSWRGGAGGARRRQPRTDRRVAARASDRAHACAPPRSLRSVGEGEEKEEGDPVRRLAIALVHHPVLDSGGATVTTAITNLDVHDLARSARTYGCSDYFIVHPIAAQRELVQRICDHWAHGSSGRRIPDRKAALELVRPVVTLADAHAALGGDV